jgi:hypothetical protein
MTTKYQPTLAQLLTSHGYTTQPRTPSARAHCAEGKDILRGEEIVFSGTAVAVWKWLINRGEADLSTLHNTQLPTRRLNRTTLVMEFYVGTLDLPGSRITDGTRGFESHEDREDGIEMMREMGFRYFTEYADTASRWSVSFDPTEGPEYPVFHPLPLWER